MGKHGHPTPNKEEKGRSSNTKVIPKEVKHHLRGGQEGRAEGKRERCVQTPGEREVVHSQGIPEALLSAHYLGSGLQRGFFQGHSYG